MYQYKNKRTGNVIQTRCKLTGETWESMKDAKQTGKQENQTETPPAPAEGTDQEDPPAEAPVSSPAKGAARKGKK